MLKLDDNVNILTVPFSNPSDLAPLQSDILEGIKADSGHAEAAQNQTVRTIGRVSRAARVPLSPSKPALSNILCDSADRTRNAFKKTPKWDCQRC